MMRTVVFCGSILPLHLFLCVQCLPVHDRRTVSKSKQLQGWPHSHSHVGLKKRGRHEQDTLNEEYHVMSVPTSKNDTEFWKRPRCGVPDFPALTKVDLSYYNLKKKGNLSRQQRRKRFALFGGRWEKTDLTYKIMRFPWQMSEDKVRRVFQEAFGVWSAVTPLRFREVTTEKADIIIDFDRYWHGDSLPFDGPGGILAHAFFPRTHREGEVHFDYDEQWTLGNDVGTDLLQVAAHEFGHVLGLQHSLEPDAVMCPFYSDSYPLQLSEDDKRGIQYLYGPPQHTLPEILETNEIDSGMPDACRTSFDAVSMIRGELFFFKSRYVWRIRDGQLQAGYPALASRHWGGIPDHIDAAYEDRSGNIWFFQGDSYWVFDAERKITGPDSVQRLGLPVTDIQAALKWEEKVYLFKSTSYWNFNPKENRVDDVHPHSMHEWGGLPSRIDAAFQDIYGYANFLSGPHYWKIDPVALKVVEGYPRSVGRDFFGCSV
ncbi:stromelysin-3-like [Seriola lalandi dorsalis]|uniref:Matrix metallopeptidase 11 n=1 Tax=Seriola lalandi dorsalis TaxID=1841481 RepID=A0A3B4YJN0_SERLL|nr:stromelysin-3-like [Seriola lalandi dorsalis]